MGVNSLVLKICGTLPCYFPPILQRESLLACLNKCTERAFALPPASVMEASVALALMAALASAKSS